MKKFFNLVTDGDKAIIYLYGDISDWVENVRPADTAIALKEAEASYKEIDVRRIFNPIFNVS